MGFDQWAADLAEHIAKKKSPVEPDEGGACPNGCNAVLELKLPENCSCHIAPPCRACMERPLTCPTCYDEWQWD